MGISEFRLNVSLSTLLITVVVEDITGMMSTRNIIRKLLYADDLVVVGGSEINLQGRMVQ